MRKISMKNKSMRKIFTAGIFSLMASTGLTSGANAAACSISGTTSFGYTGAVETCDVTQAGTYGITAIGADSAGYGAEISGNINLVSGEALTIIVGQAGHQIAQSSGQTGGGGSFVFQGTGTGAIPLIVGGGGGGSEFGNAYLGNAQLAYASLSPNGMSDASGKNPGGTNAGNGSGTIISGYSVGDQGYGYITVLSNPANSSFGSFGGGGVPENTGTLDGNGYSIWTGGGGGGYSGGGGGAYINGSAYVGGGGGSYVISSATNASAQLYSLNTYSEYGEVLFNYVGPPSSSSGSGTTGSGTTPTSVPEPSSLAILMAALIGLGMVVRYKRKGE